jgi:hypothetical protein
MQFIRDFKEGGSLKQFITGAAKLPRDGTAGTVELFGDFALKEFNAQSPVDAKYGFSKRLINGKIQIYEILSQAHEKAAHEIYGQLREQNRRLKSTGSATLTFDDATCLEPDDSVYIRLPGLATPG